MLKTYKININGKGYEVEVKEILINNEEIIKEVKPVENIQVKESPIVSAGTGEMVEAPMPGKIVDIKVKVGDSIKEGDLIAVIEAMKMETDLYSTKTGVVKAVNVTKGSQINTGDVIITL